MAQTPPRLITAATVYRLLVILAVAVAGIVLAFSLTIWVVTSSTSDGDKRDDQTDVDNAYVGCLRYNDTRLFLRSIIEDAYLPSSEPPSEALLDAFQAIADPNVKIVLSAGSNPEAITDPASKLNVQRNKTGTRDCEKEFPNHTPGLRIDQVTIVPPPPLTP